jgi:hypothetical protein
MKLQRLRLTTILQKRSWQCKFAHAEVNEVTEVEVDNNIAKTFLAM